jgi:MarR family transcriptional regulator, organic hydroperoxide resistance regulator
VLRWPRLRVQACRELDLSQKTGGADHGAAGHPLNDGPGAASVSGLKDVFSDLVLLEGRLRRTIDARLRNDRSISLNQFELLGAVASYKACQVGDIASALSLTTGGTSKLLDRVEAAGWCVRRPNPADRRSSIVELTADGKSVLAQASKLLDSELQTLLGSALSPVRLRQFASVLDALGRASAGTA